MRGFFIAAVMLFSVILRQAQLPASAQNVPIPSTAPSAIFTSLPLATPSVVNICKEQVARKSAEADNSANNAGEDTSVSRESENVATRLELVLVASCLRASKHYKEGLAIVLPIVRLVGEDGAGGETDLILGYKSWHEYALLLDSLGRTKEANHAIANSYNIASSIKLQGEVNSDYHRLGKASIAKAVASAIAARKASKAEQIATRNAMLAGYHGAERSLVEKIGEPCRITTSENTMGWIQIFWYSCVGTSGIGTESYTFVNGRMVDHTTL